MKLLLWAVTSGVAALLLSGCVTPVKLAQPPAQKVDIEPGKYTIDGKVTQVPWDTTYHFEKGQLTPNSSGFRLEPIIGADLIGLNASPWAGLRFFHIENVGSDFGFDRHDFTLGINYLWHDACLGPGIAFPFDLSPSQFVLKAGVIF